MSGPLRCVARFTGEAWDGKKGRENHNLTGFFGFHWHILIKSLHAPPNDDMDWKEVGKKEKRKRMRCCYA